MIHKPFNLYGKLQSVAKKDYDLLWENQNPSEDFIDQIIPINPDVMNHYDSFLITFKVHKDKPYDQYYGELKNRHAENGDNFVTGVSGGYVSQVYDFTSVGDYITFLKREFLTQPDQTGIRFLDTVYITNDNVAHKWNQSLIPCKIYGVR